MATLHPARYCALVAQLRKARREAKLTQVEAAKRLGITQQFLSRIELGERRIDPVELHEFGKLYGKDFAYFLTLPDEG